jgi:hypothetical protein
LRAQLDIAAIPSRQEARGFRHDVRPAIATHAPHFGT